MKRYLMPVELSEMKEALNNLQPVEKKKPPVEIPNSIEIFKEDLNQLDMEMEKQYKELPKIDGKISVAKSLLRTADTMCNKFNHLPEKLNYWQSRRKALKMELNLLSREKEELSINSKH